MVGRRCDRGWARRRRRRDGRFRELAALLRLCTWHRRCGDRTRRLRRSDNLDFRGRDRRCLFQCSQCRRIKRFTRVGGKQVFLARKANRCRRRSAFRHHRSFKNRRRRLAASSRRGTEHARLDRRDRGDRRDGCVHHHLFRHPNCRLGHRLRLHERRRGDRDDRPRNLLVDVGYVGHVRVVVHVRDLGVVDDRIASVDIGVVAATHRVRRAIHVTRTQREPCDAGDVAGRDRELEIATANESHQRGRVNRPRAYRARYPAPRPAQIGPATVMGHGETPRCVIHPRPAPRVDPCPMTIVVRSPAHGHAIRYPNITVPCVDPPRTVFIEILIADHIGRDVA